MMLTPNFDFRYDPEALIDALELVLRNSVFTAGDLFVKMLSGTAMGSPPAPPYADLFEGLHEKSLKHAYNS